MNRPDFFDLELPFFIPMWRRIVFVILMLGWAGYEFVGGSPFWGLLFGASGAYGVWALLLKFDAGRAAAKGKRE